MIETQRNDTNSLYKQLADGLKAIVRAMCRAIYRIIGVCYVTAIVGSAFIGCHATLQMQATSEWGQYIS